jgi:hypothetical protein
MMHPVRQALIEAGILQPAPPKGEPTPPAWVERPTLKLDPIAVRAIKREQGRLS